jgi:SAM-dependent methyltransferase
LTIDEFITRWRDLAGGAERADYQMFLGELCDVLELPRPNPASADVRPWYRFEHPVMGDHGQPKRIDLYKQNAFILEAKQTRLKGKAKAVPGQLDLLTPEQDAVQARAPALDALLKNAFVQAREYAWRLDADQDRPPFILVCDVGRSLEIYADFTGQGRAYRPFPNARTNSIALADLAKPEVQARLRTIWTDPHALDPSLERAKATRTIAEHLAQVSKALEKENHPPEEVATFLMRCLFAMFAEDVGLLPADSFTAMLKRALDNPDPNAFVPLASQLFEAMDEGKFAFGLETHVRRFNGAFYKNRRAFPLGREAVGALIEASRADWKEVEPAIFGSLLEQALDPKDRSRLGAHYTPRPYVERLVDATVIEPLRADWEAVQGAAEQAKAEGDFAAAVKAVDDFHQTLTRTRVLDPACGTGNFLYVTLELMKTLEAEVLQTLAALQAEAGLKADLLRRDVLPSQFYGLELNPRAAAIAELVIWIGYLQFLYRNGDISTRDPVLEDFGAINPVASRRKKTDPCVDAVLLHDGDVVGGGGTAYPNPRLPPWPEAEFIVGNPPFIGGKDVRAEQGDAYAEALWKAHPDMNDAADFVMYWWDRCAAILTAKGTKLRRFGLVTTNSITQVFQRRVMQRWMSAKRPLSLVFAVDDHPWTRAARDAAAVRIAMTAAQAGSHEGRLAAVVREAALDTDQPEVEVVERAGVINADLTVGVDVTRVKALKANDGLCSPGVKLHGSGFIVSPAEAAHLGLGRRVGLEAHVRPYLNGRDMLARSRRKMVIDLYGLPAEQVRDAYPEVYQHLAQTVKVDRDAQVKRSPTRDAQEYAANWWVFGKPRQELRAALEGLPRYIATVETAKHRIFQFLDAEILPDNKLVAIADADAAVLAVLSSSMHTGYALRAGGWLGFGNDPVYVKSRCFDPFPFPAWTEAQRAALAEVGERLDAFRKARLAEDPDLTLTRLYNALEAHRALQTAGRAMTDQERADFDAGSVLILDEIHREIDRLTLEAYGWPEGESAEERLARLVALNAERAASEARGEVRWLRPEYQRPRFAPRRLAGSETRDLIGDLPAEKAARAPFPSDRTGQHLAVLSRLHAAPRPLSPADIAAEFKGREVARRVDGALKALARLGYAEPTPDGGAYRARKAA